MNNQQPPPYPGHHPNWLVEINQPVTYKHLLIFILVHLPIMQFRFWTSTPVQSHVPHAELMELITQVSRQGEVGPQGDRGKTGATGVKGHKGDPCDLSACAQLVEAGQPKHEIRLDLVKIPDPSKAHELALLWNFQEHSQHSYSNYLKQDKSIQQMWAKHPRYSITENGKLAFLLQYIHKTQKVRFTGKFRLVDRHHTHPYIVEAVATNRNFIYTRGLEEGKQYDAKFDIRHFNIYQIEV
jgi:hypothetical protein